MIVEPNEPAGFAAPTTAEVDLARKSGLQLAEVLRQCQDQAVPVRIESNGQAEPISIPAAALQMLADILAQMSRGNGVAVVPTQAELTTQQAADLLQVSRPFLIELLESGAIPFRRVGSHRRVLFEDLMAYKRSMHEKRVTALAELTALDQELGLGY